MPGLDGFETLRTIMKEFPRPVIMVSAASERDADATFTALSCGAFDYIPKRSASAELNITHIRDDLIEKIRAAGRRRIRPSHSAGQEQPRSKKCFDDDPAETAIVAIGASTGGPRVLWQILPLLPRDLPVPILLVQHMPPGFTGPFAARLNTACSITVREAVHQEALRPGVVYIAPAGLHMTVQRPSEKMAFIMLGSMSDYHLHVPSVDILMTSVAESFHHTAMGIILTGMGHDGVKGMKTIYQQGGLTVGQDEASCTVYGMPRACAEQHVLTRVVPLAQIPRQIIEATRRRKRA
jgi:two-component system chemotaxis response regulator CheB